MRNFPRIHHREKIVSKAEIELNTCLASIGESLTEGEYLRVVTKVLAGIWSSTAKFMIREERHPDDMDQPGGWE